MAAHLSIQERDRIAQLVHQGYEQKEITRIIGRSPSTVSRELRRNVTFDHGSEFARCNRLEKHLHMQLYYAEPGCPYQRGTNENTNGLIRQYFPKGTDFRHVSHHDVRRVEALLNARPRQCLNWRTPAEVFFDDSAADDCI